MNVNGFQLENQDKVDRVVYGDMGRAGVLEGGLGESAEPTLILAHYDKLAGLITKDGVAIKTGSFWDFRAKKPKEKPDIMFVFNIGGDRVEVDDPKNLASAINVLETARSQKEVKVKEKKAKSKFKK